MKMSLIEQRRQKLQQVAEKLNQLQALGSHCRLDGADLTMLRETIDSLEDIFLIVIVGEFNAGKSSFINALLNTDCLAEGATPTTAQIQLIRYGEKRGSTPISDWGLLLTIPEVFLESMSFVDTPGTNTVIRDHEVLTKWFFPRADIVFFLTSAERPYSESERAFLEDIKQWGKKIVILINKVDLLCADDLPKVVDFVRYNAEKQLQSNLTILPLSAKLAKRSRAENDVALWRDSGFDQIELFIQQKLDEAARFQIKIESAVGVGLHVNQICVEQKYAEKTFFESNIQLADTILQEAEQFFTSYDAEVERSIAEIETIFLKIKLDGSEYFENLFRVKNLAQLLKKNQVNSEFQDKVVRNLPIEIERKTNHMVDALSSGQSQLIQSLLRRVENSRTLLSPQSISDAAHVERTTLLYKMQQSVDEVVHKLQKDTAADIGAKHAHSAVTAALAIEVSAVGIGAALTMIFTTVAADILGIVAAFWFGIAGFLVIPYYRRKSIQAFENQINTVEAKLTDSLRTEFVSESDAQFTKIKTAVEPFRKYAVCALAEIELELSALEENQTALEQVKKL